MSFEFALDALRSGRYQLVYDESRTSQNMWIAPIDCDPLTEWMTRISPARLIHPLTRAQTQLLLHDQMSCEFPTYSEDNCLTVEFQNEVLRGENKQS